MFRIHTSIETENRHRYVLNRKGPRDSVCHRLGVITGLRITVMSVISFWGDENNINLVSDDAGIGLWIYKNSLYYTL